MTRRENGVEAAGLTDDEDDTEGFQMNGQCPIVRRPHLEYQGGWEGDSQAGSDTLGRSSIGGSVVLFKVFLGENLRQKENERERPSNEDAIRPS